MSVIKGEWWVTENNEATFADGDVGDINHEGAAAEVCMGKLLGMFTLDIPDTGRVDDPVAYIAGAYREDIGELENPTIEELISAIIGDNLNANIRNEIIELTSALAKQKCTEYVFRKMGWVLVKNDHFTFPSFDEKRIRKVIEVVLEAEGIEDEELEEFGPSNGPKMFFAKEGHRIDETSYLEIIRGYDLLAPPFMPITLAPFVPPPQIVPVVAALRFIDHFEQHPFYWSRKGFPYVSSD